MVVLSFKIFTKNIMFKFLAKTAPFLTILITGISSNYASAQTKPNEILGQIEQYDKEGSENNIEQVTNVNQLRDVSPTDWSYDALKSLTERYNCISGLPDGTFQGNRPVTRNEFATGLNSCFQQIERSLNSQKRSNLMSIFYGNTRIFTEEDGSITTIIAEGDMFEIGFATAGGRTDELESRIDILEDKQFSPTTKMTGETVFTFSNTF